MFKPLPVKRIRIQLLTEDAAAASLVVARAGVLDPVTAVGPEGRLAELLAAAYRVVFADARARLAKLWPRIFDRPVRPGQDAAPVDLETLEQLDRRLRVLWRMLSDLEERERVRQEQYKNLTQLRDSLRMFAALDIDLGMLQGAGSFLALRVGTLPHGHTAQLAHALNLAGYFITPFNRVEDLDYVIVAGLAASAQAVDPLLKAADFHTVRIPAEFHDYPENISRDLASRCAEARVELAAAGTEITAFRSRHAQELQRAHAVLERAAPFAALAGKLRGEGGLSVLEGWAPARELGRIESALDHDFAKPYVMCSREPHAQERHRVPTVMSYPAVLAPFAALVTNYGVPRYGEIDPTWLFSVSFVLMFGMMFGDVGHGLVVGLGGALSARRWPKVAPFLLLAGLSSCTFGYAYGSLFGYEDIIHAVWMSPLSDPLYLLGLAVYWGIAFILLCGVLTVRNLLMEGEIETALFDSCGIAGLALYLGGAYGAYRWFVDDAFGMTELLLLSTPLALVLAHKWRHVQSPLPERVLIVIIEAFESAMSYLANTLSFLRLAAFSLNHVALAVAVFTLADMLDARGHALVVVLGNIFIIVLEGAIVAIQVLRLEYYEGFARFFRGDGRRFKPLQLGLP